MNNEICKYAYTLESRITIPPACKFWEIFHPGNLYSNSPYISFTSVLKASCFFFHHFRLHEILFFADVKLAKAES